MSDHLTEVWDRLPEKMRRQINRTDSCWLWTGHTDEKGYGLFHAGTRSPQRVPRLVYQIAHDCELPRETLVCHNCPGGDNPACCNPAHLFLGSHQDNRADCVRKGRQAKGEANGRAKVAAADVAEIRRRYAAGEGSMAALGREYGVSNQTIFRIVRRRNWNG